MPRKKEKSALQSSLKPTIISVEFVKTEEAIVGEDLAETAFEDETLSDDSEEDTDYIPKQKKEGEESEEEEEEEEESLEEEDVDHKKKMSVSEIDAYLKEKSEEETASKKTGPQPTKTLETQPVFPAFKVFPKKK